MVSWLRTNRYSSFLLLILRLYLGVEWFIHGWEKSTGGFKTGQFLKIMVAHPVKGPDGTVVYPLFTKFIENFCIPNSGLFDILVPWGELLVGLGLILGVLTTAACFFGLAMNFMYVLGGFVSDNPTYILLGIIILVAGANAGRFGGDYWVLPVIRKKIFKKEENDRSISRSA